MYLLIDPSVAGKMSLAFFDGSAHQPISPSADQQKQRVVFDVDEYDGPNRSLLVSIDESLAKRGVSAQDIDGVAVIVGEGSFTSTRVAVTVANTFAYALRIPVITLSKEGAQDRDRMIGVLSGREPGLFVSAAYSGEPNIGQKKA